MGVELTPEELERALSLRPKVPLTAQQQSAVLEMLEWFEDKKESLLKAQLRREAWAKRYPIIFGGASVLIASATAIYNIFVKATGKGP